MSGPKFLDKDFTCERLYAPSHDGEIIPITIIKKKSMKNDR